MNIHKNARLTWKGRQDALARVDAGECVTAVARGVGVSVRTLYKWRHRRGMHGTAGLVDRPSRPHHSPRAVSGYWQRRLRAKRERRWSSVRIAQHFGWPVSTVVTVLRRLGLHRLPPLVPTTPVVRYEHAAPGDMLHLDIKRLARIERVGHRMTHDPSQKTHGAGYECVHVAIDDHSRVTYAEVLADQQGTTAAGFLQRATAWFLTQGIAVQRVLTDNGKCYHSLPFAEMALSLGISQRFTRPYRPQTNGKAERLIRTLLTEWAYARPYTHSRWRTQQLPRYLAYYNFRRPHGGIYHHPPASRLP